jgi:hypothetical protein
MPEISVLMSAKNEEKYISESIGSILSQTMGDFELLLMDDGSKDETWRIMEGYKDERIRTFRNKKSIGLTKSLNMLIRQAKGDYMARLDADDLSDPHRLQEQVEFLKSNPDHSAVAGCARMIGEAGEELYGLCPNPDPKILKWSLVFRNNIRHSTVMWRNTGIMYDENFFYTQDYELWCRMSRIGSGIGTVQSKVSDIRIRNKSLTSKYGSSQDDLAVLTTMKQVEYHTGRNITPKDSRGLRLMCAQKDGKQFGQLAGMTIGEVRKSIRLYMELAAIFVKKEGVDPVRMAEEIAGDVKSLMDEQRKNGILIELFQWFQENGKDEFAINVDKMFITIREEEWKNSPPKLA